MPSTQALRRRIKSVRSTRQITKAMELVSSAKMRRATEATVSSRPYVERAQEVVADLLKQPIEGLSHPLLSDRPVKRILAFVIASDRSLAGSYNVNVAKQAFTLMKDAEAQGQSVDFITMGKKIERFLSRVQASVTQSYAHAATHPTAAHLTSVSTAMTQGFLSGTYDQVMVIYTDFRSLLNQDVKAVQLLPLKSKHTSQVDDNRTFIYEPTPLQALNTILPRLLEAELYQYLQESLASEHASRRMAMKNASDNASDMIDDLTLTYNGIRQSTITRELAEITSGAAALGA